MPTKKKDVQLCSECLGEFTSKETFVALVPDRQYYTLYCFNCMKELGIKECKPNSANAFKSKTLYVDELGKPKIKKTTAKKPTKSKKES